MGKWEMVTCLVGVSVCGKETPSRPVVIHYLESCSRVFSVLCVREALTTGEKDPFLYCHHEDSFHYLFAGK